MNEYFDLIEDDDLLNGASWIFKCPVCEALFQSKAIFNRTIFPWFGYHPSDGNCQVLKQETADKVHKKAILCDHPGLDRITKAEELRKIIAQY